MKKKSSSHVVALKQKVKERILTKKVGNDGKSEGPSTPLPASSDASDSDVPPAVKGVVTQSFLQECYDKLVKDGSVSGRNSQEPVFELRFGPKGAAMYCNGEKLVPYGLGKHFTPLPVEDSTSINQQARQVISKVPTSKPDSELARLEKSQLKGKKAQPKGGSES